MKCAIDTGLGLHWLYHGAIAQAITMAGIAAVSLTGAPPAPDQCRTTVWQPALLTQLSQEPRLWYKGLLLWYSLYAVGWFYIYWRFW